MAKERVAAYREGDNRMEWLGRSLILEQGTLLSVPCSVLFGYYSLNVNY